MINVIGRDLVIPKTERFIGMQSDNKVETRQFEVTDTALFDFNFKLDLGNGVNKDIVDLTKEIQEDKVILIWEITRENLINDGILYAQLRAYSDNDEVWHTNIDYFEVKSSINATEYYPDVLPSEFTQMEQRVTAIQTDVTEKAAEVEADRAEVDANTETVNTKTEQAIQSAANAHTSEIEAGKSEAAAAQALQELETKIGTEVPPLVDGIIPFEYLPEETDPVYEADKPNIAFITDLESKADKVDDATDGNFAGLDANGNLTDSWKKAGDFVAANAPIAENTSTRFPTWDSKGLITGFAATGYGTSIRVNNEHVGSCISTGGSPINITVPTKISDLQNDSEFLIPEDIEGKQDKPSLISEGTEITLADNTIYTLSDVTTLTLTYPSGNFNCWLDITTAASGAITISFPGTTKYIGGIPSFGNGETWELSIKNGIVVAGKAVSAT